MSNETESKGVTVVAEHWLQKYWRPITAVQYTAVCAFDFVIAPLLVIALRTFFGFDEVLQPWVPMTLREGGLYHLAMGAVLGVSAWTRGEEKRELIRSSGGTVTK